MASRKSSTSTSSDYTSDEEPLACTAVNRPVSTTGPSKKPENVSAINPNYRIIAPKAPKHTKLVRPFRHSVSDSGDLYSEATYLYSAFKNHVKIGQGSFGVVFKVTCRALNEDSAVKILSVSRLNDWKNTLSKVILHHQLNYHNNIVTLYNTWLEDSVLFIQMELCKENLLQFIMRNSKREEHHTWDVLTDILQALSYVHSENLIHLDIKPENILIGFDGRYKLADFDLMYEYSPEKMLSMVSPGDDRYRAPETSKLIFHPKSDIFSLGMTLLEMAGDFFLPNGGSLWIALRQDQLPISQLKKRAISENFIKIVQQMTRGEISQRPSVQTLLQNVLIQEHMSERNLKLQSTNKVVKRFISYNAEQLKENISRLKAAEGSPADTTPDIALRAASIPYLTDSEINSPAKKLKVARRLVF